MEKRKLMCGEKKMQKVEEKNAIKQLFAHYVRASALCVYRGCTNGIY